MITSPNPYVITSGTSISTDPSITTNGVTDPGKIYRDVSQDGPFADWAFTKTSTFDTSSGINSFFGIEGDVPIAAFKFTALELDGDPTITVGDGGATRLALIGVNGITDGNTGATFTFGNLQTVLLATQSGSITLNGIAFADIPTLYFYARGVGSDLTLGASVTGVNNEILQARHDVQVNGSQSSNFFTVYAGNDYLAGNGPITVGSIDITAGHNIQFATAQYPYGDSSGQSVRLNAGNVVNINAAGDMSVFNQAGSIDVTGATINVNSIPPPAEGTVGFFFNSGADVAFHAGIGGFNSANVGYDHPSDQLSIFSDGDINLAFVDGGSTLSAGGAYSSTFETSTQTLSAGTTIDVGSDLTASVSVKAGGAITVSGQLSAPTVTAGGDITANQISVQDGTATGSGAIIAQSGGITPFLASGNGPGVQDTLTATSIQSTGGINFNGSLFGQSAAGGTLTLNSTGTQAFNLSSTGNIQGAIDFNGADAPQGTPVGGGGTFIVNAAGAINVDTDIEASSGRIAAAEPPSGDGGTVKLNSLGEGGVVVNSRIEVSSAQPTSTAAPSRRSATGGNITIRSAATSKVAVSITSSSQLLSLLAAAAPGPGGKITILAGKTGANNSVISVTGNGGPPALATGSDTIRADRGTVDIRHAGDSGSINLTNAVISADVIKVATLGANGALNIGGGLISADTALKLYSEGSNGTVNFLANVTLSGPNSIIAANTVNITDNVVVTINGTNPASVYTNNPNYSVRNGGNNENANAGRFGGAGANTFPFANRPALDGP